MNQYLAKCPNPLLSGQKVSIWNAAIGAVVEEDTRMGAAPIALYQGGNLYYEHQDWVGTERMLTNSSGAEAGTYASLPFGDGFTDAGTDLDPYHFAGLDHDYESGLDHAQYREYTGPGGRWLSPDPYDGSYDASNPQSFNRYAYALNNPLSFNDPLGLQNDDPPPTSGGDDCDICNDLTLGIADAIEALLGLDAPSFNGSLQPRPNDPDTIQVNAYGTELNPDVNPTALSLNGGLLVPNNPNNPGNPNSPKSCADQLANIENLVNATRTNDNPGGFKGLAQRFRQMNRPGYDDAGHMEQIANRQAQLQSAIDDYKGSGCGDPPSSAAGYATQPIANPWPRVSSSTLKYGAVAVGGAIVVGGIVILCPECLLATPAFAF